LIETELVYQN